MAGKIFISGLAFSAVLGLSILDAQGEDKVYCVSNAHFDSQWNWTVKTSIQEYLPATMQRNLWLLDNYPDYVFNFEGGVKYAWMKEYYPEAYEKVKEYIRQGRWHVSGASWDANDTNVPSPESQLRNILLGQQFYKDEFGIKSEDIFLPDCFGFSYTLPSIASHAGLIGFSTQKLQWRTNPFYEDASKVPFNYGLWKGIDGSQIMCVLNAGDYTRKFDGRPVTVNEDVLNLVAVSPNRAAYMYYGVGDRGGAPTIRSVKSVTSPGNTIKVLPATSSQMFTDYQPFENHPELPVYEGELLMDVHGNGCYTSQAAMKALNRKNEQLADVAERINVMAHYLAGREYPADEINTEWQRFIWHQFHDDLTGTSIPEAYVFSWNDELISQNRFLDLIDGGASAVSRMMDTDVKGTPVMVYNPVSGKRKENVEVKIPVTTQPRGVSVYAPGNVVVPAEIKGVENGIATISFNAPLPPVSVSVFDVRFSNKGDKKASNLKVGDKYIENAVYKITLNDNGDIASIKDKRYGKELVGDKAFRLAVFDKNESYWWPSWEIHKGVIDSEPRNVSGNVVTTVENIGNASATLKIEREDGDSKFIQYITLYDGAEDDRIDVENVIDWASPATLLKAEFNTGVSSPQATYDLGLGHLKRGNNTTTAFEVPAQYWADLSDDDYGITFMTDSKYGWDKPSDNTLRLTLLHTPAKGWKDFEHQSTQDMGRHRFKYSIKGHKGDLNATESVYAAEKMNVAPIAYVVPKHKGKTGRTFSFLEVEGEAMPLVKALKMAEDGDKYVVRLYQTSGNENDEFSLNLPEGIAAGWRLNGIEESIEEINSGVESPLADNMGKFGIATYGLKYNNPSVDTTEDIFVTLPYNHEAFTINQFPHEGTFTDGGISFAAEIVPETVSSNGVKFKISKNPGDNHVLLCKNDTVALPEKHNKKYLYIMAASRGDEPQTLDIKVGNKDYKYEVPSFRTLYGQWGRTGFSESMLKEDALAYVGTHRHNANRGDDPYELTYIYRYMIPLPKDAREIIFPDNQDIAIFAATLSDNNVNEAKRVSEPRYVPGR